MQIRSVVSRLIFFVLTLCVCFLGGTASTYAADKTVRLRLAWGSGAVAKQTWKGSISINGGVLTDLQPLGLEADAPVANRIEGNKLIVNPLIKRSFDGCDLTVRADEQATVRIELRNVQSPQVQILETSLAEVIKNQFQQTLDEFGSYFLARRTPGDTLRITSTRDHLVFDPGETWQLKLQPDVASELVDGPVLIDVRLRPTGEDDSKSTWQASQQVTQAAQLIDGIGFNVPCPIVEGAYRITITARHQEGFATRFVPGRKSHLIATREVEFVVIDPNTKLPSLVDQWLPVLTIDPANPSWWQRLPAWAQVPRLRERTTGSFGNVRPVVRPTSTGELMELPPSPSDADPYWQSYTLPVREPGQPHLVELEYPLGVEQRLAISLVEPDAAGRVTKTEQDASLYCDGRHREQGGEVGIHRFVIWPRTRSPQLLIVNNHTEAAAQYGKIMLLQQDAATASLTAAEATDDTERLVAAYLSKPSLAGLFGASETLDPTGGLSVQSWSTFLDASQRLAQTLRFGGYNGIVMSVAADGSALYPSQRLVPSPRYDTGLLAANGQDPSRKDVLEMLLRIFDREGLRLVPTLQLAAPLPRLEVLRQANASLESGIGCVDYAGRSDLILDENSNGLAPFYNALNDRVQSELVGLVDELVDRYAHHRSFASVGLQLSGEGYGMMPGLASGFDDATVSQFAQATNIQIPDGADRFSRRVELLLGEHSQSWKKWRQDKLTGLYSRLGIIVGESRSDAGLVVLTENLFASSQLRQRIRGAISESSPISDILVDHAIDLAAINAQSRVTVLSPSHLVSRSSIQGAADDVRVNSPLVQKQLLSGSNSCGHLTYHASGSFRLPSFDARSPFGADETYLKVETSENLSSAAALRPLTNALTKQEQTAWVDGGASLAVSADSQSRSALNVARRLSTAGTLARTQRSQPLVLRVYHRNESTIVSLVNESPWPVQASLDVSVQDSCQWNSLGVNQGVEMSQLAGTLSAGDQAWQVDLQPYGVQAWEFRGNRLRIGELRIAIAETAKLELQQRIKEIEARASNLSIQRPYSQLQNPGFELQDGEVRILGWQPRQGAVGSIGIENTVARSGQRSLRLQSGDSTGVAIQSQLFAAPDTGQLTVSFFLRAENSTSEAQLSIAVQDQHGGRNYQRVAALKSTQLGDSTWVRHEFSLGDVPVGADSQLRLLFHVTGNAKLLLDDVALCDLRFDEARRRSLVKRIHGASIALEQGQLIDCLRVVDDHWSQFLVEHVPPAGATESVASKSAVPSAVGKQTAEPDQEKTGSSRLRGWVPKIWR